MSARPAHPFAPELPAHIGKYRVRARLGEGSTSEVFLAHDDFGRRDVAIKRLRAGLAPDTPEGHFSQHFFAAEAALVGRLQHPNVVQILDAVAEGPTPYLVMEYVPGLTLRRFCRADALLSLEQIVEVGFKCAMALGYCWRQGLIHRDVKPANVLAVMNGDDVADVKITDFGSVLNLGSDRTQVFRVGSLAYMSPEQLDGSTLDCRADMYSLAAVLYHLIAGRPPFDAQQQPALMHQIYHAALAPLTGLREGVTPALDRFVRGAMAREPGARPATWDEFARALSSLVANHEVPRAGVQAVLDSERFSLLRTLEFFSAFGDVELWEVVHRAKWQRHGFGDALYRKGDQGNTFHIIAQGEIDVYREGRRVAQLGTGTSVGEMAYLAPNPELRTHSADVLVSAPATTISFTPETLMQLGLGTRSLFDAAFIRVLVRRLHAAQESLAASRPR
jgi:eukaryotic-like serine/threonine-protein kinase